MIFRYSILILMLGSTVFGSEGVWQCHSEKAKKHFFLNLQERLVTMNNENLKVKKQWDLPDNAVGMSLDNNYHLILNYTNSGLMAATLSPEKKITTYLCKR